jgi:hypothetical protein
MPPVTIRTLVVALASMVVAVAAPAAALAQGAGDEQYADPFSGSGGGSTTKPHPSPRAKGNPGTPSPSGTSPATADPAPRTPAPQASSEANPATNTARGPQLPYTGYPAWPAALAGALLLASGTALRVSLARRT